jgi:hypothetical protein
VNALTIHQPATVIEPAYHSIDEIGRMATVFAKSGLFGVKTVEQAAALMLVAQADGLHPATVARDYDIIQGRPAKKAEAMLRDFIRNGGAVKWHTLSDAKADATFTHPQGGEVRIDWDMKRAKDAQLGGKDMWKKFPRQMLRSRVISEGIRTVCPMATGGMYVPEEVRDFAPDPVETRSEPRQAAALQIEADPVEVEDVATEPDFAGAIATAKVTIDMCESLAHADTWRVNNKEFLDRLASEDPEGFDEIVRYWKARAKELKARTSLAAKAAFPGDFGNIDEAADMIGREV